MRKYLKNAYVSSRISIFLITVYCSSLMSSSCELNTVFDSLFPATWYQKGLEASLIVHQQLLHFSEKNDDKPFPYNELLSKLAFAQFCLNQMKQEGIAYIGQDKEYLMLVVSKIQDLMGMMRHTPEAEDFIVCAQSMISTIEQQILSVS